MKFLTTLTMAFVSFFFIMPSSTVALETYTISQTGNWQTDINYYEDSDELVCSIHTVSDGHSFIISVNKDKVFQMFGLLKHVSATSDLSKLLVFIDDTKWTLNNSRFVNESEGLIWVFTFPETANAVEFFEELIEADSVSIPMIADTAVFSMNGFVTALSSLLECQKMI